MGTLFPQTISFISYTVTEGSYNAAGDWVPGTPQNLTFLGSVQPADGEDFEALPMARRNTGAVKVYSSTPLKIASDLNKTKGDVVIWQSKKWEVSAEGPFQNGLIPHYKYIANYIGEYIP